MKKLILPAILIVLILAPTYAAKSYSVDQAKSDLVTSQNLVQKMPMRDTVIQVLGPLAPVALSPFFGMAFLSGAAIFTNSGGDFIQSNDVLNNFLVFIAFAALSVVTSLPKLTTPTKALAEVADMTEKYAGIITYALVIGAANIAGSQEVVLEAGFMSFTMTSLLTIAMIVNIVVINTVKFFFELLTLISPIPFLDAFFEMANKVVCAVLLSIYLTNPLLSFGINVVIFLICLCIFNWINRRVSFLKAMLIEPIIRRIFNIKNPLWRYQYRLKSARPEATAIAKVFPMKKIGKIKTKQTCVFFKENGTFEIMRYSLIRKPIFEPLEIAYSEIEEGILANKLEVKRQGSKKTAKIAFGKFYTDAVAQR